MFRREMGSKRGSLPPKEGDLTCMCTNGQFFMSSKVLKTIYFLKGNNAHNSKLILLGLEKQNGITLDMLEA